VKLKLKPSGRKGAAVTYDKAALASIGALVRERLESEPLMYRIPVEGAEIFAVGDFLSGEECAQMMAMIDEVAVPSPTYDGQNEHLYRTSYSGNVDPGNSFVKMINRRLCDLMGIDLSWGEAIQGQRYGPGQEFKGHFDWFDTSAHYWAKEVKRGGQRSWTAMIYLNTVDEGGATIFPEVNATFTPVPGALLIWNNMLPDGTPNRATLHAATPVVRGTKYVVTKWFRTRPWK